MTRVRIDTSAKKLLSTGAGCVLGELLFTFLKERRTGCQPSREGGAVTDRLPTDEELLTKPEMPREFRSEAEAAALMAGASAVEEFSSRGELPGGWPDLERVHREELLGSPHPSAYDAAVLRPSMQSGVIGSHERAWWRQHLRNPAGLFDSRVAAFLQG